MPSAVPEPGAGQAAGAIRFPQAIGRLQRGQLHEGIRDLRDILRHDPAHSPSLFALGRALLVVGASRESAAALEAYVGREPGDAEGWNLLCAARSAQGSFEGALEAVRRSLEIDASRAIAHSNLGNVLYRLARHDEALLAYEHALALDPGNSLTRWNLGLCRLLLGDYRRGWADYESRWQQRESPLFAPRPFFDRPWWRGEGDLQGRTVLLHAEQGLGDTIQFCRYVPLVAERGARIVLEVPAALRSLVQRSFAHCSSVVVRGEAIPDFDLHCPLMSLPGAMGTRLESIPARVPYLLPDPERVAAWSAQLGPRTRPRVGIAWSGGSRPPFGGLRNVPLSKFSTLADAGWELLGLQTEVQESDRAAMNGMGGLRWLGDSIRDFDDTAAIASLCDAVVSIDTSVAHLAGAMGKAVRILLPLAPDWRWLRERGDSPWYPTARLYRQDDGADWSGAMARLVEDLRRDLAPAAA